MIENTYLKQNINRVIEVSHGPRSNIVRFGGHALVFCMILSIMLSSISIHPVLAITPPNLVLSSNTQTLTAGADNSFSFRIQNTGETAASFVTVSLTLPTGASTSMMLKNSDGRWFIGNLSQNQYSYFYATIYVSPSAANNIYQFFFTLTYQQETTSKTETRTLGFEVPSINRAGASISIEAIPFNINAGQDNHVNLTLTNVGDADAQSISLSLTMPGGQTGSTPLSLVGSDGKYLFTRLNENQNVTIPLTIYASPSSAGSIYQISASISYSDFIKTKQETKIFTLGVSNIIEHGANLNVSLTPQDLVSGTVNSLNLTLTNTGNGTAQGITVSLSLPLQGTSSSYALIGSDGRWSIDRIDPGQKSVVPLLVYVSPSASGVISALSVTTTYTDLSYRSRQQVNNIGFLVMGNVDLVILDASTYPANVTIGLPFSVTVSFINLGTMTAQSMIVIPSGSDGIRPFLNQSVFLGDIAVNVPSSATIAYIATNITSGIKHFTLEYTFRDNLGRQLTGQLDIPVRVTVAPTSSSNGSSNTNGRPNIIGILLPIILIVAVAIVALLVYRKRRASRSVE